MSKSIFTTHSTADRSTVSRLTLTATAKRDSTLHKVPKEVRKLCPLWPESVEALDNHFSVRRPDLSGESPVFINSTGRPITRFGIRYLVRQYATQAALVCPSVKSKRVSPHTFRHTTALHLLQSGNDITVVKHWLGHADVNTTHSYVEIDMKMKRKALEACEPPQTAKVSRKWMKPSILQWLDQLSEVSKISKNNV